MIKKPLRITAAICLLAACSLTACVSVKPYQKNRLNDAEMDLTARKSQKFEQSFQLYREGGSGANGGKSGGGCGCN
ncbi:MULTISPECIES: DUF4266 domain-containing protein [unclassified Mucilaginibacter]|uniref:DUF4266 domain-containing protein n=1 Tax=unclassified Mucilaginibacter TaxID=2617802 RepID=UPI00095ADA7C|nr:MULTISPECIES: DUF4266 domain-containing protein [unclassified Mucilaginibacter]HEK20509.1 DUF4266 domain-containing protein [Bacteroidota bacterium]OJW13273.1 MAG: hypothetical protein BGO48_00480 [Mucilaginibacter sp. 44-25]PAW94719.1 hypothetical protein CKK33_14930 [Mucilaginibacter sp. MD40]PLW90905.1 MAG: DUF4266 domain-containing protein [Mucilaginibacter sp.]PMP66504.1 MAG: DUF4266 domain-containing protein [Mucilaginibacter sp.]